MEKKTKTLLTAAGVAAATAGVAVAATLKARKDGGPRVYHVLPATEGWAVRLEDAERETSRHPTKKAAVEAARELARNRAPSRLVIHGADGAAQRSHDYEPL